MEEIKNLIKGMLDDLKDSKYEYDYAKHSYNEKHKDYCMYHIEKGLSKIDEMKKADKLINDAMKEHIDESKLKMLWDCLYGSFIEDAEKLEYKFKELKMK